MTPAGDKQLKAGGLVGVLLGIVAISACEFPIVLTLLGSGILASDISISFYWIEVTGFLAAASGSILLLTRTIRRWRHQDRTSDE